MLQIQNALGILSSQVPIGNMLWVDQINGVDALAARGRLTIPFKTLTAAKNGAQPGDTIVVLPGEYNEKNLLKNGVNWHFLPGAWVRYTATGAGSIFDTAATTGTNGAVTCSISGCGIFEITADPVSSGNDSSRHIVNSGVGNSRIALRASRLGSPTQCIRWATGGRLLAKIDLDISGGAADLVEITDGDAPPECHVIEADRFYTSAGRALSVGGGHVLVSARLLFSSADAAVRVSGGTTTIKATEIKAENDPAVEIASSDAELTICGARIESLSDEAIYFSVPAGPRINLMHCFLMAAASYAIDSVSAGASVQLMGAWGNQGLNGSTVAAAAGTLDTGSYV